MMTSAGAAANWDVSVIRAPSLKRGKPDGGLGNRIKLKKVLGLTVCSNASLDVSPTTGILAYPAGCTLVLFNSKRLNQSFLLNTTRKAVTAVAYSRCGRYIATGECGINPSIKIWELDGGGQVLENVTGTIVAEFTGHKNAVSCVAFSPNGKYLVSVGSQNDMIVNVFDWKSNLKIASNKVSAKVVAVSFGEDGNYFVTVGNRHVKFWYLEGSTKYKDTTPLMGRSAILGDFRNNDFCAVACGKGPNAQSTYAIIRSGHLVEFNSRRLLDKFVDCRTTSANCLTVNKDLILVGCAESIIRVFNAHTLEYITTLPRTHYLGVDVSQGRNINHAIAVPPNAKFPDTIACVYDETLNKVSCVYNDHSLYIWDLRDIKRVGKSHSFLYHSACIWGVETVPYNYNMMSSGMLLDQRHLPMDCFLTCSSDDTIRVWHINEDGSGGSSNYNNAGDMNTVYCSNIYSRDLLKVAYIDDELKYIKDKDSLMSSSSGGGNGGGSNTGEKNTSFDGRNGVRCIKISPDQMHLATGDRSGNIRIYNLKNLKLFTTIEAHDSEVLCLEYTNEKIDRKLLGSASRDRLIHVFDVEQGYQILQTLDDHSSSITSIKFIGVGLQGFQMISCGADKAIIYRTFQNNQFLRGNHCNGKNTLYDMEVDSNSKHVLMACQDRNIRVFGTQTAKQTKTFKGSHSDEGCLIKLTLDKSGIYVATSCTDKTLSVYDYYSNECMARMYGHSELVTGLKFTNDCKHLISASGDGCIFIWQIPHDMIVTMQARLSQQAMRTGGYNPQHPLLLGGVPQQQQQQPPPSLTRPISIAVENPRAHPTMMDNSFRSPQTMEENISTGGYKFSDVGQLPQWAKRKVNVEPNNQQSMATSINNSSNNNNNNQKPRGRWALKGELELDLKNIAEPMSPTASLTLATGAPQSSDYNSSSSKDHLYAGNNTNNNNNHNNAAYLSEDSSIDSGVENRKKTLRGQDDNGGANDGSSSSNNNKSTTSIAKRSANSESNTEHDGDVEDISDGERTSSEHGMMFYPDQGGGPSTPTDFTVNNMDAEELRKSMRKSKLARQGLSYLQSGGMSSSAAGTGTGTSDEEDDLSTPSGDNAERSLASTLGCSTERLAEPLQVGSATNSFLSTIDGGGQSDRERGRKSLSAMHNNGDVKEPISKSFTNSKREELLKVINSAKQKLENVGYKLRGSQSIADLSYASNMDHHHMDGRMQRKGYTNKNLSLNNEESSIRRACSLSDLSIGKAVKPSGNTKVAAASSATSRHSAAVGQSPSRQLQQQQQQHSYHHHSHHSSKRSGQYERSTKGDTGLGNRSLSVSILNQIATGNESESDYDSRGGVLRPTISSLNKSGGNANSRSFSNLRRRGLSSGNLFLGGQDDDSSSEDQTRPPSMNENSVGVGGGGGGMGVGGKPTVPPRPRSISIDQKRIAVANAKLQNASNRSQSSATTAMIENYTLDMTPSRDTDLSNDEITSQMCSGIINQLRGVTNSVLQLHERLKESEMERVGGPGGGSPIIDKRSNVETLKRELENVIISVAQSMLTKITNENNSPSKVGGSTEAMMINNNNNNNSLATTTTTTNNNNNNNQESYKQMFDTCTDLLNTVQKHVNNHN